MKECGGGLKSPVGGVVFSRLIMGWERWVVLSTKCVICGRKNWENPQKLVFGNGFFPHYGVLRLKGSRLHLF
jgi:hypothetical protein